MSGCVLGHSGQERERERESETGLRETSKPNSDGLQLNSIGDDRLKHNKSDASSRINLGHM